MNIDGGRVAPFIDRLHRALDVMSRRQQVVASNIGNVDTPGYRAQDIPFDETLARAMADHPRGIGLARTDPRHLAGSGGGIVGGARPVPDLPVRNDGNNVSIEREMLALSQTRGRYEVATNLVRMRVRQLMEALRPSRS
jgi:flagellar basal-body rod protein FlgB